METPTVSHRQPLNFNETHPSCPKHHSDNKSCAIKGQRLDSSAVGSCIHALYVLEKYNAVVEFREMRSIKKTHYISAPVIMVRTATTHAVSIV